MCEVKKILKYWEIKPELYEKDSSVVSYTFIPAQIMYEVKIHSSIKNVDQLLHLKITTKELDTWLYLIA